MGSIEAAIGQFSAVSMSRHPRLAHVADYTRLQRCIPQVTVIAGDVRASEMNALEYRDPLGKGWSIDGTDDARCGPRGRRLDQDRVQRHQRLSPRARRHADRVRDAIDQLGYRPNLSARGLRSGKTGVIGLAVPSLRENYFAELADAVIRAAEKRGLGVMVEQTGGERDAELRAVSTTRPRFLDGLLFSPVSLGQDDAAALTVDAPLVLLGERIFGGPTDHVTMHNTSSSQAAVGHLIAIGRRRIALIGASLTTATRRVRRTFVCGATCAPWSRRGSSRSGPRAPHRHARWNRGGGARRLTCWSKRACPSMPSSP